MADKVKAYENIYLDKVPGVLKLNTAGLGWKGRDEKNPTSAARVVTRHGHEIRRAEWLRVIRGFRLLFDFKDGSVLKFEGFKELEFDALKEFISQNYAVELEEIELGVKGWNWGKAEVQGPALSFFVGDRPTFEIPLSAVVNAVMGQKNEVQLEFNTDERVRVGLELSDIKFFLPNIEKGEGDDAEQKALEEGEEDVSLHTPAEKFLRAVKGNAEIGKFAGDTIASFSDLHCLHPRGRLEVELFPSLLRLRGKTHDYQLKTDAIMSLFLLEKSDGVNMLFVVGLDPPLRQGQTRYPFLVFQFPKDQEESEFKLNISEEDAEEKYKGKVKTVYNEVPTYRIVGDVFNALTSKKLVKTGSYTNRNGSYDLKCSLKASEGFIYPLEKSFLFIPKPPTNILYKEITLVEFLRVGRTATSSRMFDMKVECNHTSYTFSNIMREEFEHLYEFLKDKGLPVPDLADLEPGGENDRESGGDSGDDSDASGSGSDDDGEGRRPPKRREPRMDTGGGGGDDDDSESEDDDFQPREESEVEEEYDENAGADSDEIVSDDDERARDSGNEGEKKKAKKEAKKKRKREASSGSSGSGSESEKEGGGKDKRKKKEKKKRDPNAPKPALSVFFLYSNDNRERLKNEGLPFKEIGRKLGQEWKEVTPEVKKKYEELAEKDKERYRKEMETYVPPPEDALASGSSSSKPSKPAAKKAKTSAPSSAKERNERSMGDEIEED